MAIKFFKTDALILKKENNNMGVYKDVRLWRMPLLHIMNLIILNVIYNSYNRRCYQVQN